MNAAIFIPVSAVVASAVPSVDGVIRASFLLLPRTWQVDHDVVGTYISTAPVLIPVASSTAVVNKILLPNCAGRECVAVHTGPVAWIESVQIVKQIPSYPRMSAMIHRTTASKELYKGFV